MPPASPTAPATSATATATFGRSRHPVLLRSRRSRTTACQPMAAAEIEATPRTSNRTLTSTPTPSRYPADRLRHRLANRIARAGLDCRLRLSAALVCEGSGDEADR